MSIAFGILAGPDVFSIGLWRQDISSRIYTLKTSPHKSHAPDILIFAGRTGHSRERCCNETIQMTTGETQYRDLPSLVC